MYTSEFKTENNALILCRTLPEIYYWQALNTLQMSGDLQMEPKYHKPDSSHIDDVSQIKENINILHLSEHVPQRLILYLVLFIVLFCFF